VETNRKLALRVVGLMEAVLRDPCAGIGKPEHLKHLGGNIWSRRINATDRLVYEVFTDRIEFLQARYHYGTVGTQLGRKRNGARRPRVV